MGDSSKQANVDSILDNLTLRTHRRALLNLEIRPQTSYEDVNQFLLGVEHLLRQREKHVDNFTVFLIDITKDAFVVQLEFFIAAISAEEFNFIKQEIVLSIIQLLEKLNIKLSSREVAVVLPAKEGG